MRPMRQKHLCNTEGEASMTKEEALAAIKLLSALESWAFSVSNSKGTPVPDYLHDHLQETMAVLERIVLKDNLDSMSGANKRPLKEYP
jgi:hypothetical protein